MKQKLFGFSIPLLILSFTLLTSSIVFSQDKRCEKYYRGPDGKIVRQVVPCPSSK